MTDNEYLNMCMSRFEEAVQFHNLLNTIKLRFHNNPAAPILIQLVENMRDEAIGLGIQQYGILKEQKLPPEGRTTSDTSNQN